MKTAIIYATSHGTTAKVAQQIQAELGSNAQLFNLKQNKKIDLVPFDTVVVGGSIHAGQIQGSVKKFCKKILLNF